MGASLSFKPIILCFSFYCDHFYQSSGTHYAICSGNCSNGLVCGVFFVYLGNAFSNAGWYRGAALSFKSIVIIFIKVHQAIILSVVEQGIVFIVVFLLSI